MIFCMFCEFSNEDVISNSTKEVGENIFVDQSVATTGNTKASSSEPVAIVDKTEVEPRTPIAIEMTKN